MSYVLSLMLNQVLKKLEILVLYSWRKLSLNFLISYGGVTLQWCWKGDSSCFNETDIPLQLSSTIHQSGDKIVPVSIGVVAVIHYTGGVCYNHIYL